MSAIGFVLEKVRHGGNLSSGERKMLADEIDRLSSKVEALAQELSRREFADGIARQADRERVEHLQRVEEDVTRLRKSLEHERQRRETDAESYKREYEMLEGRFAAVGDALTPFWAELKNGGTIGSAIECMETRDWQALAHLDPKT